MSDASPNRFCVDCAHHRYVSDNCYHTKDVCTGVINLVNGKPLGLSCRDARDHYCRGGLWTVKEAIKEEPNAA